MTVTVLTDVDVTVTTRVRDDGAARFFPSAARRIRFCERPGILKRATLKGGFVAAGAQVRCFTMRAGQHAEPWNYQEGKMPSNSISVVCRSECVRSACPPPYPPVYVCVEKMALLNPLLPVASNARFLCHRRPVLRLDLAPPGHVRPVPVHVIIVRLRLSRQA